MKKEKNKKKKKSLEGSVGRYDRKRGFAGWASMVRVYLCVCVCACVLYANVKDSKKKEKRKKKKGWEKNVRARYDDVLETNGKVKESKSW